MRSGLLPWLGDNPGWPVTPWHAPWPSLDTAAVGERQPPPCARAGDPSIVPTAETGQNLLAGGDQGQQPMKRHPFLIMETMAGRTHWR